MNKVCIAGIGPGAIEYITPAAFDAVKGCDLLVGGKRNLAVFDHLNKETYEYKANLENLVQFVNEERKTRKVCVVVSGDPGFYSLLDYFLKKLGVEALEVIPGISSFQYLFARIVKPWKDYSLCSMHGRDTNIKDSLAEKGGVFLLTDRTNNPGKIADYLLEQGLGKCLMTVGENLSYPEERILSGKPEDIKKSNFSDLCVVVIEKDGMEL